MKIRGRDGLTPVNLALALLGAVAIVVVGCGNTRPCRQGTVFASLRLGLFSNADSLTVDVTVEGAASTQKVLPLSGAAGGGVEITFPSGYPAGTSLTVAVRLEQASVVLASRTVSTVLAPGCTALEIDFGGGDAGGSSGGGSGGGSGGSGGGSGGGGCVPTSAVENCYNNVDDDCNGLIDCADMVACYSTSQCVPIDPALGTIGASVQPSAECPAGAPNARTLSSGLMAAGCTGCSCPPGQGTAGMTCTADIYGYYTPGASECAANAGGQLAITLNSTSGCVMDVPWSNVALGTVHGIRMGLLRGTPTGVCLPSGTPAKGSPVWGATTKFCGIPSVGGGCAVGQACVPRPVAAAGPCALLDGARTCPAGLRQTAWFTGFTDTRTCGACACGAPQGGDCNSMLIGVGSDHTCPSVNNPAVGYLSRSNMCLATPAYSPGLQFSGVAVPPTCQASVAVSGALTTVGPQTLCCF